VWSNVYAAHATVQQSESAPSSSVRFMDAMRFDEFVGGPYTQLKALREFMDCVSSSELREARQWGVSIALSVIGQGSPQRV